MAVAECARNIACTGDTPLALTDCLNFGSPEVPETMWRFAQSVDGLAAACKKLNVPVVSGNVSFYNETEGRSILPTPTVAIVGQLAHPDDRVPSGFERSGDIIAHLGVPSRGALGGSEWLFQALGRLDGAPVGIDLDAELALQSALIDMAQARLVSSAHDIGDGGFAVCLAESCIQHGIGARVNIIPDGDSSTHALLFSEEPSRVIISFRGDHAKEVQAICEKHAVPFEIIGTAGGDTLHIAGACEVPVEELKEAYENCLTPIVGK